MATKLKLVFFGTGPVSLHCLQGISSAFEIEAIITKPDQLLRGKLHDHPVKAWAIDHGIAFYQVANKSELDALFNTTSFSSRLGVVVDFGIIISEAVINSFPLGIVNSHFSLLPEWRGADPITAALLSGQKLTGVSLMLIVPQMDAGQLLKQATYTIKPDTTITQLTDDLGDLSNRLLIETLPHYERGAVTPYAQATATPPTYSHKLTKADAQLDWTYPATDIDRHIRAYLGWPGSKTIIDDVECTITAAHPGDSEPFIDSTDAGTLPGTFYKGVGGQLTVTTGHGELIIDRLKPAGKREMTGREFLTGHPLR